MRRELPSVDDMARYEETHFFKEKIEREKTAGEKRFKMRVLSGRANPELALDICKILGETQTTMEVRELKNQELNISVEDVLGDDVYIVQPLCEGVNEDGSIIDVNSSCMELLFQIQHLRLHGAERITALIPYLAYSRQDRKVRPRVPIAASALAQLIQAMGVDRVVTVDLHRGQVQGFFHNCPVDNIPIHLEFSNYIKEVICKEENVSRPEEELSIIAPDANGVERARVVANDVMARTVCTILRRQVKEEEKLELVGDVEGQVCVIIDDLIDTGVSVVHAVEAVVAKGAKAVYAIVTHGILSDPSRIKECAALKRLVVTDSVNLLEKKETLGDKLHVITIAPMMAQAVHRCHTEVSLAAVFN